MKYDLGQLPQCEKAPKEQARIEKVLDQLERVYESNRKLANRIYDQVVTPQPTGTVPCDNEKDQEKTLNVIILGYVDVIEETNIKLDEIYKVLVDQLGSIRLV